MDQPLIFLIKLAWESRYRLPLLITIGFMALDIRMQLEINVQMRRIRRPRVLPPAQGNQNRNVGENESDFSDGSSDSWSSIDDEETDINEPNETELIMPVMHDAAEPSTSSRNSKMTGNTVENEALKSSNTQTYEMTRNVNIEN